MSKQPIQGSWKNKIVASDLQEERDKQDFDSTKGGGLVGVLNQDYSQRLWDALAFMESDPILKNTHKFYEMTKEEMWEHHMQKLKRARELDTDGKWFQKHECNYTIWGYVHLGQNMSVLNYTMFLLTIQNIMNQEQREKWEPLCRDMKIMGTYAQTEIGHGSNVQGIQTTATFDPKTDEFVIHTPCITATKWWPGDLGNFSSHAMVFARLIIEGNDYGVMPFMVQLRDLDTWMPMKGVSCGDMGPKMGYHSKNNGWCTFDNVRIPRENMPMQFVSVDREGTFSIEGDTRVLYSVMMDIRTQLVQHSGAMLHRALMIGMRYSAVRRQFKNTSGSKQETKLIDYQTQQMKLFPLLGMAYGMLMTHTFLLEKYQQLLQDIRSSKFDNLDEMHHFTSGMKSVFSQLCFDGLLQVRQSIGGAGYSAWSSLPYLIDDFSPVVTYEGDNTVMAQQSARYLQKLYKKSKTGEQLKGYFTYINEIADSLKKTCPAKIPSDFANLNQVEEALKVCSSYLIESTIKRMGESNASKTDKTNQIFGLDIVTMSQLHIKFILFKIMKNSISNIHCEKLRGHMYDLCTLMGLTFLQEYKANGFECGYFKKGATDLINEAVKILLTKLRPQAIPLVELINLPDSFLMSAVGNSYGDIYETHLEWAKTSRMNQTPGNVPVGFHKYIMPIMKGKL